MRALLDERGDPMWVRREDERLSDIRGLRKGATIGDAVAARRNLLIQGDAMNALAILAQSKEHQKRSKGKVRLCYIDPPFNTGESWAHFTDSFERSMWLTLLRDRLVQIKQLLAPDGSVWLHIDDPEQHLARCVLDEVFGPEAFVATIIWQKRTSRDNRKAFSSMHDYIHVYAPAGPLAWKAFRNPVPDDGAFWNPDNDPRGPWRSVPMTAQAGHGTPSQFYAITSPAGVLHEPPQGRCWTYTKMRFEQLVTEGRVYWPKGGRGKPRLKRFQHEVVGLAPFTVWSAGEAGENGTAKKELLQLFPGTIAFDTPKPEALMQRIIEIGTNKGDLVLDCFLGSGTTTAVAHKMERRWIGVEISEEVFSTFALPRMKRVLRGDDAIGVTTQLRWQGGGGFTVLHVEHSSSRKASRLGLSLAATGTLR